MWIRPVSVVSIADKVHILFFMIEQTKILASFEVTKDVLALIPFQCLLVGSALYVASRFTSNAMSGLVLFARYSSAPIALRYTY